VWFFGTYEMGCVKPAEIVGLRAGLDQELHAKCKRSVKVFRRALYEAYIYLQAGIVSIFVACMMFGVGVVWHLLSRRRSPALCLLCVDCLIVSGREDMSASLPVQRVSG
jgi:hypothetical protein